MLGSVYCRVVARQVKSNYFLWISELPATRNRCSLGAAFGGLFRNGQGAAELAFGSNTAALFLLILSSPLVLTPQSVRTQFRVAFDIAFS